VCVVCCSAVLCCHCPILLLLSATLRALIVCCSCCRVVACVCLVHCVATPILDRPPRQFANCISPSRLEQKLGRKTEHPNHITTQDRQHGVCLAAAHPLTIPHVLTLLAVNPEALATSSIRAAVAKQNSMSLAAAPSVHMRRTAGSITLGGVEYIHTRPTR
jgi:hypothetical protein